jgi:hypothetical protein
MPRSPCTALGKNSNDHWVLASERVSRMRCRVYAENIQGGGKLASHLPSGIVPSIVAALDSLQASLKRLHSTVPRHVPHHTLAELQQLKQVGRALEPHILLDMFEEQARAVISCISRDSSVLQAALVHPGGITGSMRKALMVYQQALMRWLMFGGSPTGRLGMLLMLQVSSWSALHVPAAAKFCIHLALFGCSSR